MGLWEDLQKQLHTKSDSSVVNNAKRVLGAGSVLYQLPGAVVNTGLDILKPFVTRDPKQSAWSDEDAFAKAIYQPADIAFWGISSAVDRAIQEEEKKRGGSPRNDVERKSDQLVGLYRGLIDAFGFKDLGESYDSDDPFVSGQKAAQGGLKMLPVVGAMAKLAGGGKAARIESFVEHVKKQATKDLSAGEILQLKRRLDEAKVEFDEPSPGQLVLKPTKKHTTAADRAADQENFITPESEAAARKAQSTSPDPVIPHDLYQEVFQELAVGAAGKLIAESYAKGDQITTAAARAVSKGMLSDTTTARLAQEFGVQPGEIPAIASGAIDSTAKFSGMMQQVASELQGTLENVQASKVLAGEPGAMAALKAMQRRAEGLGIEPSDLFPLIANTLRSVRTNGSSAITKEVMGKLWAEGKKFAFGKEHPSVTDVMGETIRNATTLVSGVMLTKPAGAVRDLVNTHLSGLNNMWNTFLGGVAEKTAQRLGNNSKLVKSMFEGQYEDAMGYFNGYRTPPSHSNSMMRLFEAMPRLYIRAKGSPSAMEYASNMAATTRGMPFFDKVKAIVAESSPKNLRDVVENLSGALTAGRFIADWHSKQAHMSGWMGRGLAMLQRKHGINYDDALRILQTEPGKLSEVERALIPRVKETVEWAFDNAGKESWSFNPSEGLGFRVIENMRKYPVLKLLSTMYFPRFWVNAWRYVAERNPLHLTDVFSKKFREQLYHDDPLIRKEAQLNIERAFQGVQLFTLAGLMRESPAAGPKYYQISDPLTGKGIVSPTDTETTSNFKDLRTMQPFTTFMGFYDLIKAAAEGSKPNLEPNEIADLILNIRRLSDAPLLSISDGFRDFKEINSVPEALQSEWLQKQIGNHMGAWTSFYRALKDVGGLMHKTGEFAAATGRPEGQVVGGAMKEIGDIISPGKAADAYKIRNTEGLEFQGPSRANMNDPNLPIKTDIFTGRPIETRNPWTASIIGSSDRDFTPLERTLLDMGLTSAELVPDFGNAHATELVKQKLGKMIGTRNEAANISVQGVLTKKLQDDYATNLKLLAADKNKPTVSERQTAKDMTLYAFARGPWASFVEVAKKQAMEERPDLFVDYTLSNKQLMGVRDLIIKKVTEKVGRKFPLPEDPHATK